MKRRWLLVVLFIQFQSALVAQAPQPSRPVLTVSLPLNINPETVTLQTGVYGRGLSMRAVSTERGLYDYPINLNDYGSGPALSVKLLIYIPGYRIVTQEFTGADLQTGKVFIPPLLPLPTAVVSGRLVDSGEKPLGGQMLNVDYHLAEMMEYFGYADGGVAYLHIASVKTDTKGEFTINVPSLLDDPFFQAGGRSPGEFFLSSEDDSILDDRTLTPNRLPARKAYAPLVIKKTQKGTLSGKLSREFLKQNNLSEDLRVYIRPGDTIITGIALSAGTDEFGVHANLKVDGSYEIQLPPGEYELKLWVHGSQESIPIRSGVVIEENKSRILNLP